MAFASHFDVHAFFGREGLVVAGACAPGHVQAVVELGTRLKTYSAGSFAEPGRKHRVSKLGRNP